MKSVVCFDKSLLIRRNALRTCKKAISLLRLAIRIFEAGFLMKKIVSKSQYIYIIYSTITIQISQILNIMHKGDGFSAKPLGKRLFHCQNAWSCLGPASHF